MKKRPILWVKKRMIPVLALTAGFLLLPFISYAAETAEKSQAALVDLEDGEYLIEVDLEGGTGKTTVTSPAGLTVLDRHAYAVIEWSSPHYDYMLVDGEKYLPVNEGGYSTFEIPVTVFDAPMQVAADTTAMSAPHEIEYTLTFRLDSIRSEHGASQAVQRVVYMAPAIMAVCALVLFISKRRRNSRK